MSYELILAANFTQDINYKLQIQVEHAASRIRGAISRRLYIDKQVVAALVECAPKNGDYPLWQDTNEYNDILIGLANNKKAATAILHSRKDQYSKSGSENAFIILRFNPSRPSSFTIINDGVGFIPAFYSIQEKRFLFSTNIHTLISLGNQLKWNKQAVIEYLVCNHPLENRTLLESIECLPPGSIIRWEPLKDLSLCSSSLFTSSIGVPGETDKQTLIDEFRETWNSIMKDTINNCTGQIGLGLSGGLDSRSIANGLAHTGVKPRCFTFGDFAQKEVLVAVKIAKRLGIQHSIFPVNATHLLSNTSFSLESLDGAHSIFEIYDAWFQNEISILLDTFVSGTSGDVFWGSDCPGDGFDMTELVNLKIAKYQDAIDNLPPYLINEYSKSIINTLKTSLTKSFKNYREKGCADIFTIWNLENRQRRWGFSLNGVVRRMGIQFENPFFHKNFIKFFNRIPLSLLHGGKLYLDIHRKLFPQTAGIKRSSDFADLSPLEMPFIYPSIRESASSRHFRLLKQYPIKGSRVISEKCIRRIAEYCKINIVSSYFKRRQEVFHHNLWLYTNQNYRTKFLHLLDEARAYTPHFIDCTQLINAQEMIYKRNFNSNPLLLGQIICLCLWYQKWIIRSIESQRI